MQLIPIQPNFNFIDIPKVASTSLKKLCLDQNGIKSVYPNIHADYNSRYFPPIKRGKTVLVWRDPIERWVSFYLQKIAGKGDKPLKEYLPWVAGRLPNIKDIDVAIDATVNSVDSDRHFAPLTKFFNVTPDVIVTIGELNSFLKKYGASIGKFNVTHDKPTLTDEQKKKLFGYYLADYNFLTNNASLLSCANPYVGYD